MSDLTTVAATLNLNANLTFDDLVNVAVSKFEDQLIERRTELQKRVKANDVERKSIIAKIQEIALAAIEAQFPSRADWAVSRVIFKFKVSLGTAVDEYLKHKQVNATVYQTIMMDEGTDIIMKTYSNGGSDEKEAHSTSFYVATKIDDGLLQELEHNEANLTELRQQLLAVNGELQSMDRKTRQVKALLAQKKMDELGITDLMQSAEISNLLQLPNNI